MTDARLFSNPEEIAALIDHTLLKPDATEADISTVCRQAIEHRFASVCVNPCWVPLVFGSLRRTGVRTCSVIGFPLGANQTRIKVEEALLAIAEGACEIDMVINVGALRQGDNHLVGSEIQELTRTAHAHNAILKVIIETSLLTNEQKVLACQLSKQAAADFVKTSTGFSGGGATEADVSLMRATVGPAIGVKASGGVRSLDALLKMVNAGASRIGTSSGVQILEDFKTSSLTSPAGLSGARDDSSY